MILELFRNPVTIIFGLLAMFFIVMGIGRHLIRKHHLQANGPKEKPYKVSDPYAEPEEQMGDSDMFAELDTKDSTSGTASPKRYFKEFGATEKAKPAAAGSSSSSGYVWE